MKIGTAQLNFKIGALHDNASLIIETAQQFTALKCDLAVFPELAITGYYPWDLLDQPGFVESQWTQLERIMHETKHLPIDLIIGCVSINNNPGKPFFNSFAHIRNGSIITLGHKQLLPTYNIFDERRHFEPGNKTNIINIQGYKISILICEDAWNDQGREYDKDPVKESSDLGVDAIISLNASPWQTGKHLTRAERFKNTSAKHSTPILYINQVGAHDEIIYDGASFATNANGDVTWHGCFAKTQKSVLTFIDGNFLGDRCDPWPTSIPSQQLAMIELGLKDYMSKCGFTSVVIGSSGGIDSALTIALASRVLGPNNVSAITMPSKYSSASSIFDSQDLCTRLGIKLDTFPLTDGFNAQLDGFKLSFGRAPSRLSIENIQARLRGLTLMSVSNDTGALLLTTGNKSEVSVGYCTLYGDMNGGLNLIGDLYKTEVYELARHLNLIDSRQPIPVSIIEKEPSAELFEDQKDSDSLPPYEELDAILRLYIERDLLSQPELFACFLTLDTYKTQDATIEKIISMVDKAEFKRWQSCPILRLHARAFGTGRRYPIAQGFIPTASMLRKITTRAPSAK